MSDITCEMDYYPEATHLSQIYYGFKVLSELGVIELHIKKKIFHQNPSLLNVKINNEIEVIYDVRDNGIWMYNEISREIKYVEENYKADFYFKRSLFPHFPSVLNRMKLIPLGLNYPITSQEFSAVNLSLLIKNILYKSNTLSRMFKIKGGAFDQSDFEYLPVLKFPQRVLFFTRLWNPERLHVGERDYNKIKELNERRIDCILTCKNTLGNIFMGGLIEDEFSLKMARKLVVPYSTTNRKEFLNLIKESNICIATTGLWGSISWKFGEYIAASRSIISEPLNYLVPGDLKEGKNYFSFIDSDSLMEKINILLNNPVICLDMMKANFRYYQDWVRPDMLVLNTLLKATEV